MGCSSQFNNKLKIENSLSLLFNRYHIERNKYLTIVYLDKIYNPENAINNDNILNLICPLCSNIFKLPKGCSSKEDSHFYCKECIDEYLKNYDGCPDCKNNFEYKSNDKIDELLSNIYFRCKYNNIGCQKTLSYSEYLKHINECKYGNVLYECQAEKYNYIIKKYEKCLYKGNIQEMENHFQNLELVKHKCIFCDEYILKIKLKLHMENECKIRTINYKEESQYIGGWRGGCREGYGIYYSDGNKYEGQWKNDKRNGFGISYLHDGNKYKGEWKNNLYNGYGICYFSDGHKYEGEWKNGKYEGYGIFYFSDGERYEGEWKNDERVGFGICYYSNKDKYEGEWKNDMNNGFGIYYYSNKDIYKGEMKNNKREGYGILYYSNGSKNKGKWKNDNIINLL